MLKIYDIKTEYLTSPVGIDQLYPRLSWKLRSDRRGVIQKSYQITAWSEDQTVWDSGVIQSEESVGIRYAGKALESRQKIFWSVEVCVQDETGSVEKAQSGAVCFEMGLLERSDWKAKWIEPEVEVEADERKPVPYLRKSFEVKPGLIAARIYQTAHGLYHFWINGKSGTEDCFKPGLTSYYYRIQYQVYDITNLVKEGSNVWSVMLGDGWWRGITGGTVKNNYGYKLHLLGQIELTYADGTKETVVTDENFKHATGGLLASDMLMGDIYDAALEPVEWMMPGFDDSAWPNVHLAEEHIDSDLIATRSVPVREKETFKAKEFRDIKGNRILDFGQNIAGYVKMKLRGCKPGQEITLIHGEEMRDGVFSIANVNKTLIPVDSFQQVTYRCKGLDLEEYCPLFAIFGFRYVFIKDYEGKIYPEDFSAVAVYSDMSLTGDFHCSNELINKLVENSCWSQKGNFMDVAVDCPTRERNAWTGDNQVYVKTAADFMDVYTFYEKWLQDQALEQFASGKVGITFPSTSSVHNPSSLEGAKKFSPMAELAGPSGNGTIGEDSVGWGDSAVWLPYMIYLCYGDKQILKNQYETARKWVDYMLTCAKEHNELYEDLPQYHTFGEDGILDAEYIYDTRMHYGEWNEPKQEDIAAEDGDAPDVGAILAQWFKEGKPLVATAYMKRSAENLAHMAEILDKKEDRKKYGDIARRIESVYEKYFITDEGVIEPGHQAAYVRALAMNLCSGEKRKKVIENLIREIEENEYCLNTGFLSTPFLLPVLVDCGYPEIAYKILEQTESPSWLYTVKKGATTIPESWFAIDGHEESLNHYSYGAVCDFLFSYVAGIRPEFNHPGYKEYVLQPTWGGSLTAAEASYETLYGVIVSGWKIDQDKAIYYCRIPENTRARLKLLEHEIHILGSGKHEFTVKIQHEK